MEKIEILPQFVFKFECNDEKLISDIISNLKNEEWVTNSNNYITKNNRLEKNEQYKKLYEWFDNCLSEVKDELKLECDKLKITQSWANKSLVTNWHHPHVHSNSLISGIFYLVDSDACTWFSIDSIWNFHRYGLGDFKYQILKPNFDQNLTKIIHKEKTVSGNLIIFPSSLYHSVDEHMSLNTERYTISFNTFPCGKIGNYDMAFGVEIDIK